MALRKKLKLCWITLDSARKICLRKRRLGLHKKLHEFSILCDVMACLIIFSPDETAPTVWPNPEAARVMIDRFFALPEIERAKKAVNQETYLIDKTDKIYDLLMKLKKKNKDTEIDRLLGMLNGRSIDEYVIKEMQEIVGFAKEKVKECIRRDQYIHFLPIGEDLNQSHAQVRHAQIAAEAVAEARGGATNNPFTGYQNPQPIQQWDTNSDNNIATTGNNNNNNVNVINSEYPVGGNNPSCYQEVGHMVESFRDMSLSQNEGNFLVGQSSANPNMNYGLFFNNPQLSYTNLVLGHSSYGHNNTNNAVNAFNSGLNPGLDLGMNPGLNLSLNTNLGLQGGFPTAGTLNENQTQGDHNVNHTWPNNDNFHQ